MRRWFPKFRGYINKSDFEIDPDAIFLDASNLPEFDTSQMEGRIERPVGERVLVYLGVCFVVVALLYAARMYDLQIVNGEAYAIRSEQNRLSHQVLFPERGVIEDRVGEKLVTNTLSEKDDFAHRVYTKRGGFSHLLGYVSYPQKDAKGVYYQTDYVGTDGVEKSYESVIRGLPGTALVETDALGNVQSQNVVLKPVPGGTLALTVDARVQEKLYLTIKGLAEQIGFTGGAGVIMDVETGELLALTSYPEFDSAVLSDGEPKAKIAEYVMDESKPFLNRAMAGVYTPGSIVKPIVAVAALEEGTIDPLKNILSTGQISIPNPFTPSQPSIFRDWKAHGYVDMREALAVSSNVYFFTLGGGYKDQKGLGIDRLNKYFRMFGYGTPTGLTFGEEQAGVVPSVEWKKETFPDEPWRLGDTYNTSIGQYGFQVTAVQAVRAVAAVANGGYLVKPHVVPGDAEERTQLPLNPDNLKVVREGMRQGVTSGTSQGLHFTDFAVATKSGTAELDFGKKYVNSWLTGFFPYEKPRYAFAVVMEQGPRSNLLGGVYIMRQVFEYMLAETPEYTTALAATSSMPTLR